MPKRSMSRCDLRFRVVMAKLPRQGLLPRSQDVAILRLNLKATWPGKNVGFGKRGLLEKRSFQKCPFSRDSREPPARKQRRIRPFSRDSREFRDSKDSRDSSIEKTPFVMTPFSGPENGRLRKLLTERRQMSKGQFRKRVALANVPSFWFSFRGNMRKYPHSGFRSGGNIRMYLRSGCRSGGNIRQNHPFGKPPFRKPPNEEFCARVRKRATA